VGNLGFSEFLIIMVVFVAPVVVLAGWLILTVWRLRADSRRLHERVTRLEADRR
jgi:hypothetical protein